MQLEDTRTPIQALSERLSRVPFTVDHVCELTSKQTERYPVLDVHYLQLSSLNRYGLFKNLITAISGFNKILQEWQKGRVEIPSILTQYTVYSSLKTRLQTIMMIPGDEMKVKNLEQCMEWFQQVTTKKFKRNVNNFIENLRLEKETQKIPEPEEETTLMYRRFRRTQHQQIPSPAQRLNHYKKRQSVFPVDDMQGTRQTFYSQRKVNYGMAGKETIQSTARDLNTLDQDQGELMPNENFEQDEGDREISQIGAKSMSFINNLKRTYIGNGKNPQLLVKFPRANFVARDKQLRHDNRSMKINKQQHEVAQEMYKWAKVKSRRESQLSKALESRSRLTSNLESYNTVELSARSRSLQTIRSLQLPSSTPPLIEPQPKKSVILANGLTKKRTQDHGGPEQGCDSNKNDRVRKIIQDNLKNIQHCEVPDLQQRTESDGRYTSQSSKRPAKIASTTLTSFTKKRSGSLADIAAQRYLPQQDMAQRVKEVLTRKGTFLSFKLIANSLNNNNDLEEAKTGRIYKSGEGLLSNPWFPKTKTKGRKGKKTS